MERKGTDQGRAIGQSRKSNQSTETQIKQINLDRRPGEGGMFPSVFCLFILWALPNIGHSAGNAVDCLCCVSITCLSRPPTTARCSCPGPESGGSSTRGMPTSWSTRQGPGGPEAAGPSWPVSVEVSVIRATTCCVLRAHQPRAAPGRGCHP